MEGCKRMMHRLKRDERSIFFLMQNVSFNDEDVPIFHRKSEKWQPPRDAGPTESCLRAFEDDMIQETRKRKHFKGSNLAALQQNGLNYLRNNKQHVVFIADKTQDHA